MNGFEEPVQYDFKKTALVIICLAAAVAFIVLVVVPHMQLKSQIRDTQGKVNIESLYLMQFGEVEIEKSDVWGNKLHYSYYEDENIKSGKVVSSGPDGELGTVDDIAGHSTDFNKSRIAGEWAGKKMKEGIRGLWSGLRKKSDFKDKEE